MNKIFLLISITLLISTLTSCSSDDSSSTSTAATNSTSGGAATVELSLSGVVTTLAGSTDNGSTNGTGTAASFYGPNGITNDGTNLYVAEYNNHMIRKIVISTGVVTTLAGSTTSGAANGTGTAASFNNPVGITTDGTSLYIGDFSNHMIREIKISTGAVNTLAGQINSGDANGTGTDASFDNPGGLTNDGTNLYLADYTNNMIRKIDIATQEVTTLAGSSTSGSANGTGTAASFNGPVGMTTDGTSLFVVDSGNHSIRKID